jgi:signal transduction histidine kinase
MTTKNKLGERSYFEHTSTSNSTEVFVQQQQEQLDAALRDFDELVYSISHDFQAPLRGINSVTEWLEADYADKLGDNGVELLGLMRSRVERISIMIERLLRYSRVGRYESLTGGVALSDVAAELEQRCIEKCQLTLTLGDEMDFRLVDYANLFNVFSELLDNVLQFNDTADCSLTIYGKRMGGFYEFELLDNGPGFSDDDAQRVLTLFFTSSSPNDIDSCGMGLPICKKTVQTMGGKFSIKPTEKRGGVVAFTWPIEESE